MANSSDATSTRTASLDAAATQQLRQKCPDVVLGFIQIGGPMQQRSDCAGLMMARRVTEQLGKPGEHYSKLIRGAARQRAELDQLMNVVGDLTLVPGMQDRLDAREVLVQRRSPDADRLRTLRHRDAQRVVLGGQRPGCVEDRRPNMGGGPWRQACRCEPTRSRRTVAPDRAAASGVGWFAKALVSVRAEFSARTGFWVS
jgi:hypothetical protein